MMRRTATRRPDSAGILIFVFVLVLILFSASRGTAQERVRVEVSAGLQATTTAFSQVGTFVEFLEDATFTVDHRLDTDAYYDGGVKIRLWRGLAAGVSLSYFSQSRNAPIQAGIPHPFFFDTPRSISGQASDLTRSETGTHVSVAWIIPATPRFDLIVSGGPSVFQVREDLVTRVGFEHSFPFDVAQFTSATTQRFEDSTVGFHAGADATWKFGHVGVGGMIRYSRATIERSVSAGNPVTSFDIGGVHAGAGLRVIF